MKIVTMKIFVVEIGNMVGYTVYSDIYEGLEVKP